MIKYIFSFILGFCCFCVHAEIFEPNTSFETCFTPGQDCTAMIVERIDHAQSSIEVQAYTLTSYQIVKALVAAHRRGVNVQVIVDQSQFKSGEFSRVRQLLNAGIPVWNDNTVSIAHNKVMVFDNNIVETGSFNYSTSAQKYNAENVLIIDSPKLAALYLANWQARQKVSQSVSPFRYKRPRW